MDSAINSGNGEIRVALDNDGNVIKVDTTKKVIELTPKAKGTLAPSPDQKDKAIKASAHLHVTTLNIF
jgi:hypothetical protein